MAKSQFGLFELTAATSIRKGERDPRDLGHNNAQEQGGLPLQPLDQLFFAPGSV